MLKKVKLSNFDLELVRPLYFLQYCMSRSAFIDIILNSRTTTEKLKIPFILRAINRQLIFANTYLDGRLADIANVGFGHILKRSVRGVICENIHDGS